MVVITNVHATAEYGRDDITFCHFVYEAETRIILSILFLVLDNIFRLFDNRNIYIL